MMEFMALNVLWLISAFTLTRQDMVTLSVSPNVTAKHGQPAILQCSISSVRPNYQVYYMEWSQNRTTLCSVNGEGSVTTNTKRDLSDFHCEYKNHQLALIFKRVQPMESGRYRCKLQSSHGALHQYSSLELEEHCGSAEASFTDHGPHCVFSRVHPDGDVHWFHGSRHLSHDSVKHHTTKRVEDGGWLTIDSYLIRDTSDVPYNCSLKSSKTGRFIASVLVSSTRGRVSSLLHNSGVTAVGTVLYISILLPLTLK